MVCGGGTPTTVTGDAIKFYLNAVVCGGGTPTTVTGDAIKFYLNAVVCVGGTPTRVTGVIYMLWFVVEEHPLELQVMPSIHALVCISILLCHLPETHKNSSQRTSSSTFTWGACPQTQIREHASTKMLLSLYFPPPPPPSHPPEKNFL